MAEYNHNIGDDLGEGYFLIGTVHRDDVAVRIMNRVDYQDENLDIYDLPDNLRDFIHGLLSDTFMRGVARRIGSTITREGTFWDAIDSYLLEISGRDIVQQVQDFITQEGI